MTRYPLSTKKVTLIYILGAGRSGTTILSTILGSSKYVFNSAELMKFYEYGCFKKECNDGKTIFHSSFWGQVVQLYDPLGVINYCDMSKQNHRIEKHSNFPNNYFHRTSNERVDDFLNEQQKLIRSISKISNKHYIVDSSKYPNRALLLKRSKNIDVKFIFNVRDARGVVNSFSKNVQTRRPPLSAVFYYLVANMMSELTYLQIPKSDRIRIKYEDLMLDSKNTLSKVSSFLNLDFSDVHEIIENCGRVDVGPVIEGNRMVQSRKIKLRYDDEWLTKMSLSKRILYYILTLPVMIINKYRI